VATYCSPADRQANNSCTTDEATQQNTLSVQSPNATIVARDLSVRAANASGVSQTYRLRVEGTDTSIACTLAAAVTTCDSGAATAVIPPGSRILLKVESDPSTFNYGFWFGWRATTP
jgi:hypothetical protein